MGRQQTTKKVKYVGTETFINAETGEIMDMQVSNVEERDFNFHKVWMRNFISTLEVVGNQKTKLSFWIIDHLDKENKLCMTYRQIAEKTGMSLDTVRLTMAILLDGNFLRRVNQGCYIVNPDIMYKGSRTGRLNVLTQFSQAERVKAEPMTKEEKIDNIRASIATLQTQLQRLQEEIDNEQRETSTDTLRSVI